MKICEYIDLYTARIYVCSHGSCVCMDRDEEEAEERRERARERREERELERES